MMYTLAAVIDCNNVRPRVVDVIILIDPRMATHEQVEIRIYSLLKYCKDGLQIEANKEVSVSKWFD